MPTAADIAAPNGLTAPDTLREKLLNIFVDPGDVFEKLIAAPHSSVNWLLPVLLNWLVGGILFFSFAAGPSFPQPPKEARRSANILDASVKPEAAPRAPLGEANNPAGARFAGLMATGVVGFAGTFWSALVLWLMGRLCLRSRFSFLKTVEIAGLTTVILALGTVVTALLGSATGDDFARPALSLLIGEFDSANKVHQALAALNFFHFWMTAVLSIGLAKLSGVPTREAAVWVFGYWAVLRIALILLA